MTDTNEIDTTSAKTTVSAQTKHSERFNHVWWLPLIALLMVTYLAVTHFTSQGPLVTITFSTAEGLAVNKTEVKYKDVVIGKVETINFNNHYKDVKVSVRMSKDSEALLRENTRFWVVKPRIGITQVSGLNTLLSGNYITIAPDKNPESNYRYEFAGLETPPITSDDEPGLRITLLSTKAASLYPGTEIYYKGMTVGTVNRVYFSDDYLWVKADVFIAAPHDNLIKPTTKFWSSNGISVEAGANGVEVSMESIETLIAGGITFDTPMSLSPYDDIDVDDGTEYLLFANKKSAEEQNTGRKHYFVTYFNGSIKGLSIGAPVTIQGMKIGKVKDIRLMFDTDLAITRIPILFEIYEDSFHRIRADGEEATTVDLAPDIDVEDIANRLLGDGLRTQLETANLLTGTKNIALVVDPNASNEPALALSEDPITGYTMLPSTQQSFDALTAGITSFINKVNKLPLNDIANNLNTLVNNANHKIDTLSIDETLQRINQLISNTNKKINGLALEQTVQSLNTLLKEGKTLSKTAKTTLTSLNKSVNDLVNTAETAIAGYSADAPLYHNVNLTLEQLNNTLGSLQTVTDLLNRHPNALVFGEEKPTSPKNAYWENEESKDK